MFDDMVNLVESWYKNAAAKEHSIKAPDKWTWQAIDIEVSNQNIAPEHNTELLRALLLEVLNYIGRLDTNVDKDKNQQQLSANLHEIAKGHEPSAYLAGLFSAYKYLPLMHKVTKVESGYEAKLDAVLTALASLNNTEQLVNDMNSMEPLLALQHLNNHTAQEIVELLRQQYH